MALSSEAQNLPCLHPHYYLITIILLKKESFNYQIIDGLNSKRQNETWADISIIFKQVLLDFNFTTMYYVKAQSLMDQNPSWPHLQDFSTHENLWSDHFLPGKETKSAHLEIKAKLTKHQVPRQYFTQKGSCPRTSAKKLYTF